MLCILIITVYFAKNNDFSKAMIFQYLQLDLALICPPLKEFDKMCFSVGHGAVPLI